MGQVGLLGPRGHPHDGVLLSASDLGNDHRFTSMVHVDYPHPPNDPDDAFYSLDPSLSFSRDKKSGNLYQNPGSLYQNPGKLYQNPGKLYQNPGTTHFSSLASLPPTMTGVEQPSSVRPRRQLPKVPEDLAVTERANRLVSYACLELGSHWFWCFSPLRT